MAGTITLRAYLIDLKAILEHESPTEVVSHCRYILQHFPKNVETYRLLAQALLQRGHNEGLKEHFDEAAEVFRRVLSASPIDYVAHLGLSEIFEYDGELDRAIWHMERAYEQLPGNQMLQEALRDLYAKRDGEENAPEKIQLTRAALARQYINGQLFDQALVELRKAMEQAPDRKDLHVLLAETLWESQHPIEAGEVAVQILKQSPANMTANRIMAQLWLANERPTDAQPFLDRLEALDPYAARELVRADGDADDPNTLERLDYHGSMQATLSSETPDWVQSISEFDVTSNVQNPFEMPPDVDEAQAFGGWADDDAIHSPAQQIPDWFSDDEPTDWGAPPEPSAVPDWFGPMDSQEEFADPADQAPVEANWLIDDEESGAPGEEPAAVAADWLVEDDDSADASGEERQDRVDASWLFEEGGTPDERLVPDDQAEEQPAPVEPVDVADTWLADEPDFESESDMAEDAAPEADWLAEQGDSDAEGDTEAAPAPSSGFTDLLQGIETQQALPEAADEAQSEPTAPDWLADHERDAEEAEPDSDADLDELFAIAEREPTEEFAPEPDLEDLFADPDDSEAPAPVSDWLAKPPQAEESPEDASGGVPIADEEGDAFWAAFDQPPKDEEETAASEAASPADWFGQMEAAGESQPEQEIISPEWLPDSGPLMASDEDERSLRGETDDWLAGLEEIDEQGVSEIVPESDQPDEDDQAPDEGQVVAPEAADEAELAAGTGDWVSDMESAVDDDLLEILAVSEEGEVSVSEHDDFAGDEIERAEIPDWIQAAAPLEADDESTEQTTVPDLPEPVMDEDLMALFEESTGDVSAETDAPELASEAVQEPDFVEAETPGEDWLGSFTAAGAEMEAVDESPEPGVSEDDDWIASIPGPDIEAVSDVDEALSFEDADQSIFESDETQPVPEADEPEEPILAEALEAETLEDIEGADVEEAAEVGMFETVEEDAGAEEAPAAEEDSTPAWLADMEPVAAREEDQEITDSLLDQPYDPFEGGSPDNVPQYASAKATGILQPDESPDWMSAFTGEELPDEKEPFEEEAEALESDAEEMEGVSQDVGQDAEPALEDESESEADQEWEDEFPAPTDVLADYVYSEDELEEREEDDREMPDWLVAITSSESEKIEGLLPDEPEKYSSAEDTGVLQPGSEPDWLKDVSESVDEAEEAWAEEETFDEGRLWSDLEAAKVGEAGAESEDEDDFDFAMLETMADGAPEPADDEARALFADDEAFAEVEMDEEFLLDLSAASREQVAVDDDELVEESEVAQPGDLEHTKVAVLEAESVDFAEGEADEEPVPEDFSFYDLLPLWLRQPLERDPDAPMSADYEGASGRPEWLRDVSEDEEDAD